MPFAHNPYDTAKDTAGTNSTYSNYLRPYSGAVLHDGQNPAPLQTGLDVDG